MPDWNGSSRASLGTVSRTVGIGTDQSSRCEDPLRAKTAFWRLSGEEKGRRIPGPSAKAAPDVLDDAISAVRALPR